MPHRWPERWVDGRSLVVVLHPGEAAVAAPLSPPSGCVWNGGPRGEPCACTPTSTPVRPWCRLDEAPEAAPLWPAPLWPARLRLAGVLLAAATVLLPCGCGLPRDGAATSVPPTAVPYNLLSPAPSDASAPAPTERTTAPHLYLVNVEDELVPVRTPVAAQGLDPVEAGCSSS